MDSQKEVFVYRIDNRDKLCYTSKNWDTFALENETPECRSENVLGNSIWKYIDSAEIRYLYQDILQKIRGTGKSIKISINCDSPSLKREMLLTMIRLPDNSVEHRSRMVRITPRDPVELLEPAAPRDERLIRMCSYCKSIAVSDTEWLPTEEAVVALQLLNRDYQPRISHGVCPACYEKITREEH